MQKSLLKVFLTLLSLCSIMIAQTTGSISGKVIDANTGEAIIGANVFIEGTNIGAASDLDGKFFIKNVPAGSYTVILSFISYSKTKITNVVVNDGKTTTLNATLSSEAIQVGEVIVTDKKDNSYESALLNQQKKSINISDGISAEQIKRSTDATTADALKRISGITLSDDKFVYVRGTSERYSGALLNNSPLASTEPDKKSFAFDLIPSNLIENSVVIKSFTPDNPGNFTGGLIKVSTVDFPSESSLNFSYSTSYIPDVTTQSINTYSGGTTDYLGIDDGTRSLPDDYPVDLSTLTSDSTYKVAKEMPNIWKVESRRAPINQTFSLSYGDRFSLFDNEFGLISSISYRSSFNSNLITSKELYANNTARFDLEGTKSEYSVLWGALLNLSYKLNDFNKIGFRNSFTVNSDDEVIQLDGIQYDKSLDSKNTALRFVSRSLYSGQLFGESYLAVMNGLQINWRASYSKSHRDEPDYRRYTYGRDIGSDDPYSIILSQQTTLGLGGRYYSTLNENNRALGLDLAFPLASINFKFGGSFENSDRAFRSRLISNVNQPTTAVRLYTYAIDSVFAPKNFSRGGFAIQEYINGTNNYTANQEVTGAYLMFDVPFDVYEQNFRLIAGFRNEIATQRLQTLDISRRFPINVDRLESDLLPSVNFIYKITDDMNLRLSFARTINRPEFREIAPFQYYEFETQTSVEGNENLISAKISNYDLRYEIFPGIGELVSLSVFYKELMNAIERSVIITSFGEARTFSNAPFARNYGFEIEARTTLSKLADFLSSFSVIGNYTWIRSEIDDVSSNVSGRSARPLQGQSPYVINLSLNYRHQMFGTTATISFNKIGRRILEVADQYGDDIYEEPRDLIDFVLTQGITDYLNLKFTIRDLLAKDQVITQEGEILRKYGKRPVYSLGLSLNL